MAETVIGASNPLTERIWAKSVNAEAFRSTYIGKFLGSGQDSLFQELENLKKAAGDSIITKLRPVLSGDGVVGDAVLEGNEEALEWFDDRIYINQLRHATKIAGRMSEQRVAMNMRTQARDSLKDWWAIRMDTCAANHLCGNTAEARAAYTGNNPTIAPSTNRIIRAGNQATDQALTTSDILTLDLLDVARYRALNSSTDANTGPLMRPIMVDGKEMFVVFMHDAQEHQLKQTTATGQWRDIQMAALMGGDVKNNPIFTGALGIYNGMVLHSWSRITQGIHASTGAAVANTRRAVLCGAQALSVAFGSENGATRYTWEEDYTDYKNKIGFSAGCIFGIKKNKFAPSNDSATNQEDFSTMVISTYAATPTPA